MPGANSQSSEDTIGPLLAVSFIGFLILWMLAGAFFSEVAWLTLRAEAVVVATIQQVLPIVDADRFGRWTHFLAQPVPETLDSPMALYAALEFGGRWIRWPVVVVVVVIFALGYRRHPQQRYSRVMDFEGLLRERMRTHPRMRPIMWLKGRSMQARGQYTPPLSPFAWAHTHGIVALDGDGGETAAADSFDEDACRAVLGTQLGVQLRASSLGDLESTLRFHEYLLTLTFLARAAGRDDLAAVLLDDTAIGFGPAWPAWRRLTQAVRGRALLDWPADGPWVIRAGREGRRAVAAIEALCSDEASDASVVIRDCLARRAFTRPFLADLLSKAQRAGIITTSDFIWLKAVDRPLHYALNDLGRRVASAEAAGVRAHMQAEDEQGAGLDVPHTDAAMVALRKFLDETDWKAPTGWMAP